MKKVTYENKINVVPKENRREQVWAEDLNEIKAVVNALVDIVEDLPDHNDIPSIVDSLEVPLVNAGISVKQVYILKEEIDRIKEILQVEDLSLDTLQEINEYIKNTRERLSLLDEAVQDLIRHPLAELEERVGALEERIERMITSVLPKIELNWSTAKEYQVYYSGAPVVIRETDVIVRTQWSVSNWQDYAPKIILERYKGKRKHKNGTSIYKIASGFKVATTSSASRPNRIAITSEKQTIDFAFRNYFGVRADGEIRPQGMKIKYGSKNKLKSFQDQGTTRRYFYARFRLELTVGTIKIYSVPTPTVKVYFDTENDYIGIEYV